MLYWGFGLLMLAISALVVSIAGVPGLGPIINVALLAALVFLAVGVVTFGHRRQLFRRHAHR
jgi:hypothetical protein